MIGPLRISARRVGALLFAGIAWAPATGGPVAAEEARPAYGDLARELAEELLVEPGVESLDAASRAVIERALVGGGTGASADESRSTSTAEVLLFTSLSVPTASWRTSARDASRIGAPLVLRGVAEEGLPATARRITDRLGEAHAGVAIDPRLFRLFGIARVPAVVVVPGGVSRCRSRGCADDAPPSFDRVSGNLSLAAALEAIAAEGDAGRAVARRYLAILRGTGQ